MITLAHRSESKKKFQRSTYNKQNRINLLKKMEFSNPHIMTIFEYITMKISLL